MLKLNIPKNKTIKIQGYILRATGQRKIQEFSFLVDVADCSDSVFKHIFINLNEPMANFDFYFYLENKKIEKIDASQISLIKMRKSHLVLILVETRSPLLQKQFCFEDKNATYFSFLVMYKNQVKSIEQIIRFKTQFVTKELYLLVFYLFWDILLQYWSLDLDQKEVLKNLSNEQVFEHFKEKQNFPFEIQFNNLTFDDLEKEYHLDQTEKNFFVVLKPEHFKKINSLKYSRYLSVPNKTKVGGNQMELKSLIEYNLSAYKNHKCTTCKQYKTCQRGIEILP